MHAPTKTKFRPHRRMVAILLAVVAVGVIAALTAAWRAGADLDVGTPPPVAVPSTEEEQRYYAAIAPRYREVAAQTRALADLGAERSRNLLEIARGQDRVESLLDEIDAFHAAHGVPARFAEAGRAYREGAANARAAMTAAREAFRRFDWDRVARATAVFETGALALEDAVRQLDAVVAPPGDDSGSPG